MMRFECTEDGASKFWELTLREKSYVTEWGKIGANPRSLEKRCKNFDEAKRLSDVLWTKKLKEGYRLVWGGGAPGSADALLWLIVGQLDWRRTGEDAAVIAPAVKMLAARSEKDILAFSDALAEKLFALDGEAFAACIGEDAYVGEQNAFSVDAFLYARCCVVANGEDNFNLVLADPHRMPRNIEFEAILGIAEQAWLQKTGRAFKHVNPCNYETFSNKRAWASRPPARG